MVAFNPPTLGEQHLHIMVPRSIGDRLFWWLVAFLALWQAAGVFWITLVIAEAREAVQTNTHMQDVVIRRCDTMRLIEDQILVRLGGPAPQGEFKTGD